GRGEGVAPFRKHRQPKSACYLACPMSDGRPSCARCMRPVAVCYCAHLQVMPTRTRVLLLQHPREQRMAIGTARMAHLSLPGSALRVGTDFSADPVVTAALADPSPPYVLF